MILKYIIKTNLYQAQDAFMYIINFLQKLDTKLNQLDEKLDQKMNEFGNKINQLEDKLDQLDNKV